MHQREYCYKVSLLFFNERLKCYKLKDGLKRNCVQRVDEKYKRFRDICHRKQNR